VELKKILAAAVLTVMAFGTGALAQDAETEKAIEKYRQMLREDPWSNPGFLDSRFTCGCGLTFVALSNASV